MQRLTTLSTYFVENVSHAPSSVLNKLPSTDQRGPLTERWLLFNYMSFFSYSVTLKSLKTSTLEWTLPSPMPADTFIVPPKVISSKDFNKSDDVYTYRENYLSPKMTSWWYSVPLLSGMFVNGSVYHVNVNVTFKVI